MTFTTEQPVKSRAGRANKGAKPGERRGGRPKGQPNVITRQLKDMILAALDMAGGVDYLREQAAKNPGLFLTLVGKVLPLQVGVDGPGGALAPRRVIIELEDGSSGAYEK